MIPRCVVKLEEMRSYTITSHTYMSKRFESKTIGLGRYGSTSAHVEVLESCRNLGGTMEDP